MPALLAAAAAGWIAFAAVASAACVRPEPDCLRQFPLTPSLFGFAYATRPLDRPDASVTRAVIMVHGAQRNADTYFLTATASAFMGDALEDTLIVAPAFHASAGECHDRLQPGEVNWSCSGDSWRSGGASLSSPELTSFDFVNRLVTRLADRRLFPNLKSVTLAGHSAGGQFVARYAMANRIHDQAGVKLEYIVANPSSYAWPDENRPLPKGDGAPAAAEKGWSSEKPHTNFSYAPFDRTKAADFNRWPYGLEQRQNGYTRDMSAEQLRAQLASRPITYLLSQVDTLPLGGFDGSAGAMAQGPTRRARGEAYVKYVNERLGGKARIVIVPECGHNNRCVFTTDEGLQVLFPPRRK